MATSNTQRNNGWFASRLDYIESTGFETTIYVHEDGNWRIANTGESVTVADLPVAPADMWPVRLTFR